MKKVKIKKKYKNKNKNKNKNKENSFFYLGKAAVAPIYCLVYIAFFLGKARWYL